MDTYKRMNRLLGVIQFTYLSALASFINYLVLYLNNIGFSELYIGVINAAGAAMMLVIQGILGRILDRTQNFRQVVRVVLAGCILGVAAVPFVKTLLWLELILIVLLYAVIKQFGSVLDLWTYQLKSEYPDITYGSTRGIGSVGEGIATFILGYLIAWFGFAPMFIITLILLIAALWAGLKLPNPVRQAEAQAQKKIKIKLSKRLMFYFSSFLLLRIAATLIGTFCSLMVQRLGGGSEMFGLTILFCGIAELPTFILMGRWCHGDNLGHWYRICLLMAITGSVMDALAPNIPIYMVGRVMLTLVYAIYTVINLEYIKKYVEPTNQAQVMLMFGAVSSSVGYMASSLLGGYLLELGSQTVMAIVMAAILAVAFILHIPAFSAYEKSKSV